jgi:hypothetical protein
MIIISCFAFDLLLITRMKKGFWGFGEIGRAHV